MTLRITLDTNCFFDYFQRAPHVIQPLVEMAINGQIELAMTTRVMADTLDKWMGPGASPIWQQILTFPELKTIGSAFRLGTSRLGMGDYLVSDSDGKKNERIGEIMQGAQIEDVDHIFAHIIDNRDIFTTSDNHFLKHQEQLKKEFGAIVLEPQDAIQEIRKRVNP